MRHTGRAIIIHEGRMVLIERWRPGKHYFSIPGGEIEVGESPGQAAVREVKEETGLEVSLGRLVYEMQFENNIHSVFLCEYISGDPHLPPDSEEAQKGPDNLYEPKWINLEDVKEIAFGFWGPIGEQLVVDIANGFANEPKTLAID